MTRPLVRLSFFLLVLPGLAHADATGGDGAAWLRRIAVAAHQLDYSGTFVYRRGAFMETSRIVHVSDQGGEHEKLEVLDGPPREIIRNNDEVICYVPEAKAVIVEKRKSPKSFPALLPLQLTGISENYAIRLGGVERVAGYDCQTIILEPRDTFRYGHRLCAESVSGLLLKAVTVTEKGEMVDQFSFTQASIGGTIDRGQLKPKFSVRHPVTGSPRQEDEPVREASGGQAWMVKSPPAGFRKVVEARRVFPGKKFPISHLVFSDQLAAVSVFIEPLSGLPRPVSGLSSQGAIHVYARPVGDYQVTVLGEVPAVTVTQIANSVSPAAK